MTAPIWLDCTDADVPAPSRLVALVEDGTKHVVLKPPGQGTFGDKAALGRQLRAALPEWVHVFDSGVGLTILPMLRREVVLAEADAIVEAAGTFRLLACALGRRLAARLDLSPEHFGKPDLRFTLGSAREDGTVNRIWKWWFHGYEVCFSSERGLVLDCRLGFGADLGTLDPAFFARFVGGPLLAAETVGLVRDDQETAERLIRAPAIHRRVHALLRDDFHRACRAFDVLEAEGRLVRVAPSTPGEHPGLVAPLADELS